MMEMKKHTMDQVTVITCDGRLNMVAAPEFRSFLDRTVDEGSTRLVVDLAAVGFMDSSGLGALIAGLKSARRAGGDLRIAGASPQVLAVLELTNLQRILLPYPTVREAADDW